jgi:phosphohistidine swiveling domain-containing protein
VTETTAAREAFGRIRQTTDAARLIGLLAGVDTPPPAVLVQPFVAFDFTGVALWPKPATEPGEGDPLRVEASSRGRVVDGDAAEPLPEPLTEAVRRLALHTLPWLCGAGLDLEWGALMTSRGWEVTLLQARPLLPSAQDPPEYMARGVWIRNSHHHPRVLSIFYASIIETTRARQGLAQGAWLGRLYERDGAPVPVADGAAPSDGAAQVHEAVPHTTDQSGDVVACNGTPFRGCSRSWRNGLPPRCELPAGPLFGPRRRLQLQTERFLRFVRTYLTRPRRVRPGASCVFALLAAAPGDCVTARDRWFRFCEIFPAAWDPQAPSIAGDLERLRALCQGKPDRAAEPPRATAGVPANTPWRVFADAVDSREQDDWVFARMLRVLRTACLEWGAAAVTAGWLDDPMDVFLLTHGEILSGQAPAPELFVRRRALQRAREAFEAPARVVDGVPQWPEPVATDGAGELNGQAAVPGRAEGTAGPLPGPGEGPPGRIAVVHALTPQDIVFLPGVSGLIVERPGVCGHAVLIARELGIPTVTGADRCLERIPPGARVWLDGTRGRIRWHQDY